MRCVDGGVRRDGAPVFRCNVNFGEPHIEGYCVLVRDGRAVTQVEDRGAALPADAHRRRAVSRVVAAARAAAADAAGVLECWARQPSGSDDHRGLAAMRVAIAERAATLPGTVEEVALPGGQPALRVAHRPAAARRLLLVGHYDTVHTAAQPGPPVEWTSPGVLTGPGVADMKGGILVALAALAGFEASPAAGGMGWELLLTPDEELGAPRSRSVLEDAGRRADAALVFEPAAGDGDVVVARRGRCVVNLDVTGRAAHAGRDPWNGRSAVAALAELILAAEAMSARADGRVGQRRPCRGRRRGERGAGARPGRAGRPRSHGRGARRGGGAPGRRGPGRSARAARWPCGSARACGARRCRARRPPTTWRRGTSRGRRRWG